MICCGQSPDDANAHFQPRWGQSRYRIETETRFYELTEERRGAIASLGDIVDFRIEKKDKAFVRNGEKEWKCMVTGVEQKSLHSKPKL